MKSKIMLFLSQLLFASAILISSGCEEKEITSIDDPSGQITFRGTDSTGCTLVNPSPTVSSEEIEILKHMREEEKLARDVYMFLFDKYNVQIFSNIAKSEQRHMDRIKCLLDYYNIEDPALPLEGEYSNPAFIELYKSLTTLGGKSVLDAFKVGTTIEDLDIKDLNDYINLTENPAMINIFKSLVCGSRNHLRSFYAQVLNEEGTYTPQYIDQVLFDSIVNSDREFCGNNTRGNGSNKGNSKKNGHKIGNCNNSNTGNNGSDIGNESKGNRKKGKGDKGNKGK